MKKLRRPNFNAKTTIELCISSLKPSSFKTQLSAIVDQIQTAETVYLQKGSESALFAIKETSSIGTVTKEDMKKIYKNTFVKSAKTRYIYDTIKKLPKNDTCPLCNQRTVSTLDHYLSQDHHASLVVTPINLVPSCSECNKNKLNAQPRSANDQTFHPYFDDFDDERWLFASIEQTTPPRSVFRVEPPNFWSDLKKKRAEKHFAMFQLGALYGSHSASEIMNIRHLLEAILNAGTSDHVKSYLSAMAQSAYQAHRNSWQTAAYHAFSESDWFCAGGFRNV